MVSFDRFSSVYCPTCKKVQPARFPRQGRFRRATRARGNGERHFHNEKRSNETHASTTDPDARLYRKGSSQAAKLSYMGHALMENRHGLVVGATVIDVALLIIFHSYPL